MGSGARVGTTLRHRSWPAPPPRFQAVSDDYDTVFPGREGMEVRDPCTTEWRPRSVAVNGLDQSDRVRHVRARPWVPRRPEVIRPDNGELVRSITGATRTGPPSRSSKSPSWGAASSIWSAGFIARECTWLLSSPVSSALPKWEEERSRPPHSARRWWAPTSAHHLYRAITGCRGCLPWW